MTLLSAAPVVQANPVVLGTNSTVTFSPGFAAPNAPDDGGGAIPPDFPYYYYQGQVFNDPVSGARSVATAGASTLALPNVFGAIFPVGTGVGQTAPAGAAIDAATLRIAFNIDFKIVDDNFGPRLFEFYNFSLAGRVGAGPGDYVSFVMDADFSDAGGHFFPHLNCEIKVNNPGNFARRCSGLQEIFERNDDPGFLAAGDLVNLKGFIEFKAKDDGLGDSTIYLSAPGGFSTPEPSALLLAGAGLAGSLLSSRWRTARRSS